MSDNFKRRVSAERQPGRKAFLQKKIYLPCTKFLFSQDSLYKSIGRMAKESWLEKHSNLS